jgi:hypothetical protein
MNQPNPQAGEWQPRPAAEFIQLGEESLRRALLEQAVSARRRYAPLTPATLEALLQDPDCVRYPTRLVYEFGDMARHQFAQPEIHIEAGERGEQTCLLYLRPSLREHPEWVVPAVVYMLPVINYGPVVTDEHCLLYGAALLGLREEAYYEQVCRLADSAGAETLLGSSP